MAIYTTGELAKLCDVSVRTVQYYDNRGILTPVERSEGDRRLYSDEELRKLRLICFLRDTGFSIENIGRLFSEEEPENIISMLIDRQKEQLVREVREGQQKLERLNDMKRSLKNVESPTVDALGDIVCLAKNRKKRRRAMIVTTFLGLLMDAIEVGVVIYGVRTGSWWHLAVGIPVLIGLGVLTFGYYYSRSAYICQGCHSIIHPRLKEALWSRHTPNTRRLRCPKCGRQGFCLETYHNEKEAVSK